MLAEHGQASGVTTNNVAEHRSDRRVGAGLQTGAAQVAVRMDLLVVEQMTGRWKVTAPVWPNCTSRQMALASTFESVSFTWIPREQNKHADRLANEAMDGLRSDAPAVGRRGGDRHRAAGCRPARQRDRDAAVDLTGKPGRPQPSVLRHDRPNCPGSGAIPPREPRISPTPAVARPPTPGTCGQGRYRGRHQFSAAARPLHRRSSR